MTPGSISINRKVPTVCFLLLSSAALEPADGSLCPPAGAARDHTHSRINSLVSSFILSKFISVSHPRRVFLSGSCFTWFTPFCNFYERLFSAVVSYQIYFLQFKKEITCFMSSLIVFLWRKSAAIPLPHRPRQTDQRGHHHVHVIWEKNQTEGGGSVWAPLKAVVFAWYRREGLFCSFI